METHYFLRVVRGLTKHDVQMQLIKGKMYSNSIRDMSSSTMCHESGDSFIGCVGVGLLTPNKKAAPESKLAKYP
jgi:hypothetical protein